MGSESSVVVIRNSMALLKSTPPGSLTTYGISEQYDEHMFCLRVYHNGDEHDVECSVDDEDGDEGGHKFASHVELQLQVFQNQDVERGGGMTVHCICRAWYACRKRRSPLIFVRGISTNTSSAGCTSRFELGVRTMSCRLEEVYN